jgi:hypothetical protein
VLPEFENWVRVSPERKDLLIEIRDQLFFRRVVEKAKLGLVVEEASSVISECLAKGGSHPLAFKDKQAKFLQQAGLRPISHLEITENQFMQRQRRCLLAETTGSGERKRDSTRPGE